MAWSKSAPTAEPNKSSLRTLCRRQIAANSERARRICSIINGFYANHAALSHRGGQNAAKGPLHLPSWVKPLNLVCSRSGRPWPNRNPTSPPPDRSPVRVAGASAVIDFPTPTKRSAFHSNRQRNAKLSSDSECGSAQSCKCHTVAVTIEKSFQLHLTGAHAPGNL